MSVIDPIRMAMLMPEARASVALDRDEWAQTITFDAAPADTKGADNA